MFLVPVPALGSDQCHNAITAAHESVADLHSEFLDAPPPLAVQLSLFTCSLAKFGQNNRLVPSPPKFGVDTPLWEILNPPLQMFGN